MKFELEKTKEIILLIKSFNITKYLLNRKERKIQTSIMLKEGSIEHWKHQIGCYESDIVVNTNLITQAEKEIVQLEKDIKKLVKVINLYIFID